MGYIHEMIPVLRKTSSTTRILSSSYEVELKAPKDYLIRQPGFWKRKLLWCFFLLLFNQKTFFFANKNLLSATQKTFDEITSNIKWSSASLSFFFSWRHFFQNLPFISFVHLDYSALNLANQFELLLALVTTNTKEPSSVNGDDVFPPLIILIAKDHN